LNHHHAIGAHEICPPEAFHFDELCQLRARFPYAAVRHGGGCARDERYQQIISINDIHVRVFFPMSAARVMNDRTESRSYLSSRSDALLASQKIMVLFFLPTSR
jgi:hypothetical protein